MNFTGAVELDRGAELRLVGLRHGVGLQHHLGHQVQVVALQRIDHHHPAFQSAVVSCHRLVTGEPSGLASSLYISTLVDRRWASSGVRNWLGTRSAMRGT